MKVRVKGLVFVGFAAAIFAQSAMADNNADAKTVTSKLYVDQKVETTTGDGSTQNPYVSTITANNANADTKAPSIRNVYEFVMDKVGDVDVIGDNTYTKAGVVASGDDEGKFKVELQQTPMLSGDDLNGTLTNDSGSGSNVTPGTKKALVTAQAVQDLLLKETTAGTTTITQSYAENNNGQGEKHVPTVRNVYDFVTTYAGNTYQPKAPTTDGTSLYLGHNTVDGTSNIADWKQLEAAVSNASNANPQATTDYVSIRADNSGVYQVNIPQAQIANYGATTTGAGAHSNEMIAGNATRLTTVGAVMEYAETLTNKATAIVTGTGTGHNYDSDVAYPTTKAVYDFVTTYGDSTYHPVLTDTNGANGQTNKVMIGYKSYDSTAQPGSQYGESEWKQLNGDGTYITVGLDASNNGKVQLDNLTTGTANFVATGTTNAASYRPMLAKAGDVYDFVIGQTGGNLIPAPTGECVAGESGITSSNNKACALVLAYWDSGESPTGQAGVGLKWVPMPQP